ncbi:zinc finger protein 70 [Biomphalaria pfeifferi]|uniref:Zinc finger protein 70 n=1 Tax=Biomphalaria pfeifferi TaxID=112525 RepID=A0AAD8EX25_BIOPF|nr:zinc finger protein 70 [Biomphalaria pfeifferi]
MTARGLLQHVQHDHKMKIYLQKGPLLIQDVSALLPPPAHSFLGKGEYSDTNTPTTCADVPLEPCEPEQPTDLSLTYQNSSETPSGVGDKDGICWNLDDGTVKEKNSATSTSALPKKRKFLNPGCGRGASVNTPSVCSSESVGEDFGSIDNDNQESGEEFPLSDITGECTPIKSSARTGTQERNAKLKALLQKSLTSDREDGESVATPFHYDFPLVALKKESNADDSSILITDDCHGVGFRDFGRRENGRLKCSSTMEQSIDKLIRASISKDSFSEDYDFAKLNQKTSLMDAGTVVRFPPACFSPRLYLPGENYKHYLQTQINIDFSSKMNMDLCQLVQPKLEDSPLNYHLKQPESQSHTVEDTNKKVGFYGGKSRCFDPIHSTVSDQKDHLSMSDPSSHAQLSDPQGYATYQNRMNEVRIRDASPAHQIQRLRHSLEDTLETQFSGHPGSTSRGFEPSTLISTYYEGRISFTDANDKDAQKGLSRRRSNQSNQDLATVNDGQLGTKITLRSHSESFDESCSQPTDALSRMDTDDFQLVDGKLMKKRRYPTSRPFKCIHCEQAFNQRIHLKKHMSKHTGVKPFKCQQCDYSTVERSHLKVHYRIHTGEKPYRCLYCDYATAQNSTLKIHLKRHHEGTGLSNSRGRELYLGQGLRDDDDNLLNDKYLLGLSTDNEGGATNRAASIIGQDYSCPYPEQAGSDYSSVAQQKVDSSVGHFSFFSNPKDNMYSYGKNTILSKQLTTHLPLRIRAPYDSHSSGQNRSHTAEATDLSRAHLSKLCDTPISNSTDVRQMLPLPAPESSALKNEASNSSKNICIKESDTNTAYLNKNGNSEKSFQSQAPEIQTNKSKDYKPCLYSVKKGKEMELSLDKEYINHDKNYKLSNDHVNLHVKDCGPDPNYMTEQNKLCHLPGVSKSNFSERDYKLNQSSKEACNSFPPLLDLKMKEPKPEQQIQPNHKSDHCLNQNSNDDEINLDYNIGLPTVNIPNKEFVRG